MDPPELIATLNRLLQILNRSLAVYLQHTRPWARANRQEARQALANLAADQEACVEQIAETVERLGGRVEPGRFPLQFTSTHDLALDYLVKKTAEHHARDVEAVRRCAAELADEPGPRFLAEKILDNQQGHLETLEGLLGEE